MTTTLEGDRAWLEAFRRGERDALLRVFRCYVDDVMRTVRTSRVPVPEHEREAIVQEVFARAFQPAARARFDGVRPFGAWLSTIARNLITDRARREGRLVATETSRFDALGADDRPADEGLERQQLQRILTSFRAQLTPEDRACFDARFEHGCSIPEAARRVGCSEITMRRRDTRLRTSLLDALRREGFLIHADITIGSSLLPRRTSKP